MACCPCGGACCKCNVPPNSVWRVTVTGYVNRSGGINNCPPGHANDCTVMNGTFILNNALSPPSCGFSPTWVIGGTDACGFTVPTTGGQSLYSLNCDGTNWNVINTTDNTNSQHDIWKLSETSINCNIGVDNTFFFSSQSGVTSCDATGVTVVVRRLS
jgi:hypothetical protein